MAFLAVITADGGIPIFQHSAGEIKTKLPFATVGALNGVHMFSRLREAELKSVVTPEEKILWREYHERLVLILITKNDVHTDCHLSNLLDNIFAAMAMLIGIDILLKQKEVMKLQKALVVCHTLIEYFLNQIDLEKGNIGDLTCSSDCMLASDSQILQGCLGKFLNVADSLYGCLLIKGKIAVASKEWWTLTNQEKVLLCCYVNCLPKVLSRETIIYLPTSSPQSSNRLITLHLLRDVEVCVLCSAEPSISILEEEAPKIWKVCFDALKITANLHPRNIPPTIVLDTNILGLILINRETGQSVCSLLPAKHKLGEVSSSMNIEKQQEALRTLYKIVIGTYFKNEDFGKDPKLRADNSCSANDYGAIDYEDTIPQEFYMCLEDNKCYVIHKDHYQIYILYTTDIPTYALRSVSHKTMKLLMDSKLFPQV